MKCSICNEEIPVQKSGWDKGNNAEPVNDGRCCDFCNSTVVIPARINAFRAYEAGKGKTDEPG